VLRYDATGMMAPNQVHPIDIQEVDQDGGIGDER
jgi:hypothetical protein